MDNILRIDEVLKLTGLSKTTVWRLERAGEFPSRLLLGEAAVGWKASEIQSWIESRPRGIPKAAKHLRRYVQMIKGARSR